MTSDQLDEMGSIDYVVLEWPSDARPSGDIQKLLLELVDRGIVRVLDIAFVRLSAADAQVQAEIDRLLDQATQQPSLTQAIDIYKQVQMVALKNAWQYVPALLRVNYIGCHMPSTGGCEDNPMRGDGFIRPGDFWVKK